MKAKAFVSGIIVGAAISSVAALLTTPTSGLEVRTNTKEKAKQLQSGFEQFSKDTKEVKDQIKATTQISKETFKEVGSEIIDSINDWKRDVEPTLEQLKTDMDSLQKNIEQTKQTFSK